MSVTLPDFLLALETLETTIAPSPEQTTSQENNLDNPPLEFWMRMEAEDFELDHYNAISQEDSSGAGVITTEGEGKATATFNGPDGTYKLVVGYYDDNANVGQARLSVKDADYTWTLDQGLGTASASNNFFTYEIEVDLESGDRIKFEGEAEGNEYVRLDYIDVIQVNPDSSLSDAYFYNGNFYTKDSRGTSISSNDSPLQTWVQNTFGTTTGIREIEGGSSQINVIESSRLKGNKTRLEAEDLTLSEGYVRTSVEYASNNAKIINVSAGWATATTTITGKEGIYNLYASYFDSSAGNASASVLLNGNLLNSWQFNANTDRTHRRTLGLNLTLNEGDVLEIRGLANNGDYAQIDYLELERANQSGHQNDDDDDDSDKNDGDRHYDQNGKTNFIQEVLPGVTRVEVEDMNLTGTFKIEEGKSFASGNSIVRSNSTNSGLTANTTFAHATGVYDITIGYYEEDDEANFSAKLNGAELDQWQSTLDLGDGNASLKSYKTHTLRGVLINSGDIFSLGSIRDDGDLGRLDYVDFALHDSTVPIRVEAEYMQARGEYDVDQYDFVSTGRTVTAKSDDIDKRVNLSTTFDGPAGIYNVVVAYDDENDGNAKFTASVEGVQQDAWVANQQLGDNNVARQTLTKRIISNVELNPGDTVSLTSLKNGGDEAHLDYIEFVLADHMPSEALQIEVEQMDLAGNANIESNNDFAFGGGYVTTGTTWSGDDDDDDDDDDDYRPVSQDNQFRATSLFKGETGYYDVVVGYYDSKDGAAEISVAIDNQELDRWYSDQNAEESGAKFENFTTHTVATGVQINQTDLIEITAMENGKDKANIDYIKFIPVEAPVEVVAPIAPKLSDNGDVLRGGRGNDTLHGGLGADILYGEDENDQGGGGNDVLVGGEGDDTLYGNSGDDWLFGDETDSGLDPFSTVVTPVNIPNSYTFKGHTYVRTDNAMSWEDAEALAVTLGGHLVTINDATEETWLKKTFGTSDYLWTGLTDREVEGVFKWVSGEEITYTNWTPGEPNNGGGTGNADYVRMNYGNAQQWADYGGNSALYGIIEIDTLPVIASTVTRDPEQKSEVTQQKLVFQQGLNDYRGTVDTFLQEAQRTVKNGKATSLNVDGDDSGGAVQGLLRFEDLFGEQASQIDSESAILSAVLEIDVSDSGSGMGLYEMRQNWVDTATWNSFANGIQANGVEAASTAIAQTNTTNSGTLKWTQVFGQLLEISKL